VSPTRDPSSFKTRLVEKIAQLAQDTRLCVLHNYDDARKIMCSRVMVNQLIINDRSIYYVHD